MKRDLVSVFCRGETELVLRETRSTSRIREASMLRAFESCVKPPGMVWHGYTFMLSDLDVPVCLLPCSNDDRVVVEFEYARVE